MIKPALLVTACLALAACGVKSGEVDGSGPDQPRTYPSQQSSAPHGGVPHTLPNVTP